GGAGTRFNGIAVHANGIAVENLTVRGYASDGIVFTPAKDVPDQLNGWRVSFVTAANNGLHGIEALRSRGGTIDHVLASGHGAGRRGQRARQRPAGQRRRPRARAARRAAHVEGLVLRPEPLPHLAADRHREGAALPVRRAIARDRPDAADGAARRRLAQRAPA